MTIQFINCKEWGIEPKQFDVYIKRLKKHVPDAEGVLNVVFVNDDYIQALNKQYRDKDEPTDVLSFSYLNTPDFEETGLIGEVYISVDTARRNIGALLAQSEIRNQKSEMNTLFVHGFLHVFGHNHESDEDCKKMEQVEREILS